MEWSRLPSHWPVESGWKEPSPQSSPPPLPFSSDLFPFSLFSWSLALSTSCPVERCRPAEAWLHISSLVSCPRHMAPVTAARLCTSAEMSCADLNVDVWGGGLGGAARLLHFSFKLLRHLELLFICGPGAREHIDFRLRLKHRDQGLLAGDRKLCIVWARWRVVVVDIKQLNLIEFASYKPGITFFLLQKQQKWVVWHVFPLVTLLLAPCWVSTNC